jgi:nucleoside-diphosphate-sugar epimerase
MRILITGGHGHIGTYLVQALRLSGQAVRVLDLRPPGDKGERGPACEFLQGSVGDPGLVAWAVRDVAVVFHLAWGFGAGEEWREMQENLCGTLNLLQAALAAGVQHFLFVSSAVVYGPTGPSRADEAHPCHPERSTIGGPLYGTTKLAAESLCLIYQRRGLPVTVFRLHGVFDGPGHFGAMVCQALAGVPVQVNPEAGGEYIHVQDALEALLMAMGDHRTCGEVFNLAGSYTYRDLDLANLIIGTTGTASSVDPVEDPSQGMISVSVDKLRRVLGYEPCRGEFLSTLIRHAIGRKGEKEPIGWGR